MYRGHKNGSYARLPVGETDQGIPHPDRLATQGDLHQTDMSYHYHGQQIAPSAQAPRATSHPAPPPLYHPNSSDSSDSQASSNATTVNAPPPAPPTKEQFDEERQAPAPSQTFIAHRRRMGTNFDDAPVEVRHTQDYFLRRPRPLMVEHQGHVLEIGENGKLDVAHPERSYHLERGHAHPHSNEHHPDSLKKQRERVDLFVDLIWVGIISNISEHFFARVFEEEVNPGGAIGEFVLLFIPAFKIWSVLQQWLNCFYMDDYFQRLFVVWIMILGMVWGNNAPYLVTGLEQGDNFTIVSYLVAIASFGLAQAVYSGWLPWLRSAMFLQFVLGLPGAALWVALTIVRDSFQKQMLLMAAIIYGLVEVIFFASPLADRILGNEIRQVSDNRTMIRRYENFFIIALGEGVFLLIRESPLGRGFNIDLGRGVLTLLIYYSLNWLYFHGDVSKRFIQPMDRRWWIKLLWQWLHVPLFGALVLLSSGTLFLVRYTVGTDLPEVTGEAASHRRRAEESEGEHGSEEGGHAEAVKFSDSTLRIATITTCLTIAVALLCMTMQALLCRSLDERHSLLVTRPWLRMLPRAGAIVFFSTIWLVHFDDPTFVLGIITLVIGALTGIEQLMGMPHHAKLVEPKGETLRPVTSTDS